MRTNQNSTKKKPVAKKRPNYMEDYLCMFSFRMKPITDAFLDKVASDLISWSSSNDSLIFSDFYLELGIPKKTFEGWCERYAPLREAKQFALMRIGNRREKGGLGKKFDSTIVMRTMPMYSEEWRKRELEYAALTKTEEKPTNVTVFMDAVADTPEVLQRIEDIKAKELKKKAMVHD